MQVASQSLVAVVASLVVSSCIFSGCVFDYFMSGSWFDHEEVPLVGFSVAATLMLPYAGIVGSAISGYWRFSCRRASDQSSQSGDRLGWRRLLATGAIVGLACAVSLTTIGLSMLHTLFPGDAVELYRPVAPLSLFLSTVTGAIAQLGFGSRKRRARFT